jgi:hypothetical protein
MQAVRVAAQKRHELRRVTSVPHVQARIEGTFAPGRDLGVGVCGVPRSPVERARREPGRQTRRPHPQGRVQPGATPVAARLGRPETLGRIRRQRPQGVDHRGQRRQPARQSEAIEFGVSRANAGQGLKGRVDTRRDDRLDRLGRQTQRHLEVIPARVCRCVRCLRQLETHILGIDLGQMFTPGRAPRVVRVEQRDPVRPRRVERLRRDDDTLRLHDTRQLGVHVADHPQHTAEFAILQAFARHRRAERTHHAVVPRRDLERKPRGEVEDPPQSPADRTQGHRQRFDPRVVVQVFEDDGVRLETDRAPGLEDHPWHGVCTDLGGERLLGAEQGGDQGVEELHRSLPSSVSLESVTRVCRSVLSA